MKTPVFTLDRIKTGDESMLLPSLLQSTLSVNWFKLTSGYLDPIPQHDIPWELSPTVRDMAGGWMNVNGDDVSVLIIVYQYTLVIWRYNTDTEEWNILQSWVIPQVSILNIGQSTLFETSWTIFLDIRISGLFYKSTFASKLSWKKRSSHQGKNEVACIVSKPLVSCLLGCGESVNPPKLNIQEV